MPLGDGHGPAPSHRPAQRFLTSPEIQAMQENRLAVVRTALLDMRDEVDQLEFLMALEKDIHALIVPLANSMVPGVGTSLDVLWNGIDDEVKRRA